MSASAVSLDTTSTALAVVVNTQTVAGTRSMPYFSPALVARQAAETFGPWGGVRSKGQDLEASFALRFSMC